MKRLQSSDRGDNAMSYIDGFLLPVPAANREKYIEVSKGYADYVKKLGALEVKEWWGNDVPDGKLTSFPMSVKLEEGEVVVFSWVMWPDKATRDAANEKMMNDPDMANIPMPFDGKRMMYGGFEPL
jgi:uncharacterized protein YbaA (DUF1428 family)